MVNFKKERDYYRLIDGAITLKKPVGYCHLEGHRGFLSKSLYCSHECKKKQCPFFQENIGHPYLQTKQKETDTKKEFQSLKKQYTNNEITLEQYKKALKKLEKTLGNKKKGKKNK